MARQVSKGKGSAASSKVTDIGSAAKGAGFADAMQRIEQQAPAWKPSVPVVSAFLASVEAKKKLDTKDAIRLFDIAAEGNNQTDEALILTVEALQTGKLSIVALSAAYQSRAEHNYRKAWVRGIQTKCANSQRTLAAYEGDELEGELSKYAKSKTHYLTVEATSNGTMLRLNVLKVEADTGNQDLKAIDSAVSKLSTYCEALAARFGDTPATLLRLDEAGNRLAVVIDNKRQEIVTRMQKMRDAARPADDTGTPEASKQ